MRIHLPLISLGAIFVLPAIAAALILNNLERFQHSRVEHGKFVSQPYAITLTKVGYIAGSPMQNKWTLVYVPGKNTELNATHENLLRKLHIALNKEKDRVTIVEAPQPVLPAGVDENSLLVLNPQGLYIMYYDNLSNIGGLLADVRRLLKYSHA